MKASAQTVDKTIYCITIIVLQQLIVPQLFKESAASNKNHVELKVILHPKSCFFIPLFAVLPKCGVPNKTKNLE